MRQLVLTLPPPSRRDYPILVGRELFFALERILKSSINQHWKVVIITDDHVQRLYGEALEHALQGCGYSVLLLSFPAGEKQKTAKTKIALEEAMLQHQCGRETMILALGGGVVGDMAGFVAATYLRGIPYLQLPTTLLAMVDSSIGGKTGINTAYGKNLIGALWHPQAVIADLECLQTLSPHELTAGLVEAVKMFLTNDAVSFYRTQESLSSLLGGEVSQFEKLITTAVSIKMDVVQRDEQEQGERMILNFGHTIGHALEQVSHYTISHAAAVAMGIVVESKISQLLGILSARDFEVIHSFFKHLKLKLSPLQKISFPDLLSATRQDKKTRQGQPHYVLLRHIGEVQRIDGKVAHAASDEVVLEAWDHCLGAVN